MFKIVVEWMMKKNSIQKGDLIDKQMREHIANMKAQRVINIKKHNSLSVKALIDGKEHTNIVLIGMQGSGKSTILNSMIRSYKFLAGPTYGRGGRGMTIDCSSHSMGTLTLHDVVGLGGASETEKPYEYIRNILSSCINVKLIIVIQNNEGRMQSMDVALIKMFAQAAKNSGINIKRRYGIIMNKVPVNTTTEQRTLATIDMMYALREMPIPAFIAPIIEVSDAKNAIGAQIMLPADLSEQVENLSMLEFNDKALTTISYVQHNKYLSNAIKEAIEAKKTNANQRGIAVFKSEWGEFIPAILRAIELAVTFIFNHFNSRQ